MDFQNLTHEVEETLEDLQRSLTTPEPVTTPIVTNLSENNAAGRALFNIPNTSTQQAPTTSVYRSPTESNDGVLIQTLVSALEQLMTKQSASSNLPKLPLYSAETDCMEWGSFLESFTDVMNLNGWEHLSNVEKATLLRSSLTKRAADTFNGLPASVKQDFELAKIELTKIFVNPAKKVLYQNEFDNRVQGEKESLQDLVTSLRRLARRGYPEVASNSQALDSFVHRRFIEAIRSPTLRNQVRLFRRDTVEQTLVEAYRLEAALAIQWERTPTPTAVTAVRTSNVMPRDSRQTNQLICYNCQKPGHFARNCYSRYGTRNAAGSSNPQLKDWSSVLRGSRRSLVKLTPPHQLLRPARCLDGIVVVKMYLRRHILRRIIQICIRMHLVLFS